MTEEADSVDVLVVEDDPAVAQIVLQVLKRQGWQTTLATSVREGNEALQRPFDVAVLDVSLPDGKGFQLLDRLRDPRRPAGVVMMTGELSPENVSRSIRNGVSEFLAKPFTSDDLCRAVRRALQTTRSYRERLQAAGSPVEPKPVAPVPSDPSAERGAEHDRIVDKLTGEHGLTERERETLDLMLAGLQNVDIAEALNISANTVKYHVRNILTKLELESRTELFRFLIVKDED